MPEDKGTIQRVGTPEEKAVCRRLRGEIRSAQAAWESSVEGSIKLYHRYTAKIFDFCERRDHGIDYPMSYLEKATGFDKSTVSRMRGDGATQAMLASELPMVNSVAARVLRPALPLLRDPTALKSAVIDALDGLPEGVKLTAKHVRESVKPYRDNGSLRGAAAHRRNAEPIGAPDSLAWTLTRIFKDAVGLIKGQDVPDPLRKLIEDAYQAARGWVTT